MTKDQINRLEMFLAVQTYLDAHTATWSSIPIIASLKTRFDELITTITENQENQASAQVSLGKSKSELKKTVAFKTDILNDTLEAYAEIEEDNLLKSLASKSYSQLYTMRNEDFKVTIKQTIDLLEALTTELADYGVTVDQITDLKSSYDEFLSISGEPTQYRIKSRTATLALEEAIQTVGELLASKLDKLMKRYQRSNPGFYNGYQSARVVVDH